MNGDYTFDRVVQLSKQLSDEMQEASRWRVTATDLAHSILDYITSHQPGQGDIIDWLQWTHPDLYQALSNHSNRLHGDPDRWHKHFQPDDI